MYLTKKTTILFPPELHRRLTRMAERRGKSLGELVREACQIQYGIAESSSRVEAAKSLAALSLPVSSTEAMKRESVPAPDDLLP